MWFIELPLSIAVGALAVLYGMEIRPINLLPPDIQYVRVVELVGLDLQADGGTHVANTREVGPIHVVDYKSKGKINKRLYIEMED